MTDVMVIAVHPDDETLGCGGTLLRHKFLGDKLHWLIATSIHDERFSKGQQNLRRIEIDKVRREYAFDSVHSLNLPTMKVDEFSMSDLVNKISLVLKEVKPTIIYLPYKNDIHSDHRKVFEAAFSCTKSFRYPFVKKVYMMETLSETEFATSIPGESFSPTSFVDISNFLERKIEIMQIYLSEIEEHPFPRSITNIRALATYRGATAGVNYAESFMLLKEII